MRQRQAVERCERQAERGGGARARHRLLANGVGERGLHAEVRESRGRNLEGRGEAGGEALVEQCEDFTLPGGLGAKRCLAACGISDGRQRGREFDPNLPRGGKHGEPRGLRVGARDVLLARALAGFLQEKIEIYRRKPR